ncbi:hypothetical protein O181_046089 [Austropuccinia psidii MF-1]|uniref:Uncharacterized protein n=1 Tax=Austropuccinia psidii MF-1 TaxID=1389203 RepID=A0A9Q3DN95_9BASI|nr:hypothetical protein [Austropuccinia psidii MF-1]
MRLRVIKSPSEGTYTGYYNPNHPAHLGESDKIDIDMTNKIVADDLGIVIDRTKIPAGTKGNSDTLLKSIIQHTDWDNQASHICYNSSFLEADIIST